MEFLQNQVLSELEEVAPENEDIWFQMGCPAHNSRLVNEYLQNVFHGQTMGLNYNINWSAMSPDLSPNEFFLWGHFKNVLFKNIPYDNHEELKMAISTACNQITAYQLSNVIF